MIEKCVVIGQAHINDTDFSKIHKVVDSFETAKLEVNHFVSKYGMCLDYLKVIRLYTGEVLLRV